MADGRALLRRSALVAFVAAMVLLCTGRSMAATTTYTGVYAGGTISPGNTVLLNNGASVAGNVFVNGTLQFNQTGSLAISSTLSGSGTLSIANSGTLTLLATNTNSETTLPWQASLTAGRLNIGTSGTGLLLLREVLSVAGGALTSQNTRIVPWGQDWNVVPPQPEAAATLNGGSWINSGNLEVAAAARRSGRLTVSSGGFVAVGGTLNVTSYTLTDSSYLPPRTYTTFGSLSLQSGGTLQIGLGGTTGVLGIAGLGFDGTLAFNRSNSGTYSGALSGSGSVVQLGSGTMTLSGSNSYSGPTRVERGLLRLSGSHYAPLRIATGTVSLAGPYVLFGGNTSQLTASNLTVSAGATLSLDTEKFSEADVSRLASLGTGSTGFLAGSFLALDTSRAYLGTYTYSGTLADTNNGMDSLTLCKTGTGTLILSGSNSYSGGTVIESGTLKVTGAIRGNIRNNGTLVNARSGTVVWSGTISGTGALIQEGEILVLSGSNSYTGPTRTRYGELRLPFRQALYGGDTSKWTATNITTYSTLRISVGGPNEFTAADIDILKTLGTGSTGFVNDSWLALDTSNAASGTFTYSGALTNPNSGTNRLNLMKTGSAILVLLGSNSYTGVTCGRNIQIGNGGSSGSIAGPILEGPFVFNSAGSLTLTGSSNLDAPYSSQPTPVFTKLGTGTMSLTGVVDCYDLFVVDGGVCNIAAGSQLRLSSFGLAGIHVGRGSQSRGLLTVDGGHVNSRINWLGSESSSGVLRLNSGTMRAVSSYSGNSDWTIYNGEIYINGGYFQGGFAMYGSGTAIISGGTANLSKALVGSVGYGILAITGGVVRSDQRGDGVTVGKPLGGNGLLTVSGGDVKFPSLVVGEFGVGRVSVSGGQFGTSDTTLGVGGGGLAVVSVTGGTWTNSGNMTVGGSGTGIVVIGGSAGGGVLVVGGTITQGGDGSSISVSAGGILQVGSGGTTGVLGLDALTNSGTLIFNRSDASSYSGAIAGPGQIVKQGVGTLTLTGSNSYTGGTLISAGTLQIGGGGTSGWIVGGVANDGVLVYNRDDSATLTNSINGTGDVIKRGSGHLTLLGSNRYTGGTFLDGGTLVLGSTDAIGSTGAISFGGGTLQFSANNTTDYSERFSAAANQAYRLDTNGQNVSLATPLVSTNGSFTKLGAGTLDLTGTSSALNTVVLDLTTTASAGMLQIRSGTGVVRIGSSGTGTLNITGGSVTNSVGYVGFSARSLGTATVSGGTWANRGSLSVGYSGSGTLNITGGSVTTTSGTLGVSAGGLGTATVSSGTWSNSGNLVVGVSGTGTLTMSGGLVTVGGTLSKGTYGTVRLSPGGTLQIGTGGTTGVLATDLTSNGTLVFNRSTASIYSGILSGSGLLSKQGSGLLSIANANTLTGSTTIQQGTLQLAHTAALSASTISPLAGGTLSLLPALTMTSVGGLKPNAGGVIDVGTGMITVAAGLSQSDLVTALQVGRGVGSWNGLAGICSTAIAGDSGARTIGWLDNGDGSVTFGYAAPGDTNLDWQIDVLDVANFIGSGKFNTGLSATWAEGDSNYDGFADVLDIADFMSSGLFNAGSYNTPAVSIVAVPEPSILGLVGAGVAGLTAIRRKRAS